MNSIFKTVPADLLKDDNGHLPNENGYYPDENGYYPDINGVYPEKFVDSIKKLEHLIKPN